MTDTRPSTARRQCVLHLGMNKTGSTTIQAAMRSYETDTWKWLHDPQFTPAELMQLAFPRPQPKNRVSSQVRETTQALRTAALASLHGHLSQTDKDVLLSSEYLSSPRKTVKTQAIVDTLLEHVDDVRAMMYLRDPVTLISSHYQQRLRTSLPPPDLASLTPKYRRSIAPWDEVLGRDNVTIRIFDPQSFVGGSLLTDFATHVGLDAQTLPKIVPAANVGLSLEATALLFAYRQTTPHDGDTPNAIDESGQRIALLHGFGSTKLRFGSHVIQPVLDAAQDEIEWAQHRAGRAFPTPKADDDHAIQALDELGAIAHRQIDAFHGYLEMRFPDLTKALAPLPRDPAALIAQIGPAMVALHTPAQAQRRHWYERILRR